MIDTQIIKENDKPVAVIIDYKKYLEYLELKQDSADYQSALDAEKSTTKWTTHEEMLEQLELE